MRAYPMLVALLFMTVAFAGCADESDGSSELTGEETVNKDEFQFSSGKGAIAGLLVDDRFRPIDLEADGASGEFQAAGFILVQETGAQLRTNENGEFNVLDLDPGTYTLRTQAEGYEAIPQKVTVTEGEFAETNIVARRKANTDETIITDEYSVFSPCSVGVIAASASPDCTGDQSGDTNRFSFTPDYTIFPTLTFMVTEMVTSQDASPTQGSYKLVVRNASSTGQYWANDLINEGNYLRLYMEKGTESPFDIENRNGEWHNTEAMQVALFAQGQFKAETQAALNALEPVTCNFFACPIDSRGLGAQFGVRAQFVVSLFLNEPETDIEAYCVLC